VRIDADNLNLYDQIWDQWDSMKRWGPTARHTRRFVLQLLDKIPQAFNSFLDVGCGTGLLLAEVAQRYPHVRLAGSELSQRALAIARQRVPQAAFFAMDLEREAAPEPYDVVACIDVLEHIPNDEAALRNLWRSTRYYLILSVPLGPLFPVERERYGHVHGYQRPELEAKVRAAGFRLKHTIQWGFPFYNLHRRMVNALPAKTTAESSHYSWHKKALAYLLYVLFFLNLSYGGERYYSLWERIP